MPELKPQEYMKEMNGKQRMAYIWEYYKVPIILVLAAIILVTAFLIEHKTKDTYVLSLTLIGDSFNVEKQQELSDTMTDKFVKEYASSKYEVANVEFIPTSINDGKESLSYEYAQKLVAKMATGELDVVVMSKTIYEAYAEQGAFLSLEDMDVVKSGDYEVLKSKDEQGRSYVSGIRPNDGASLLTAAGYKAQEIVICIVANTEHKEMAEDVVRWLINE